MNNKLLSTKLKELRKIHSYTQDYVASVLGVARQTYSHYETGKRTPNSEVLFVLAGLYNISVEDLMQLSMDIDKNIFYDAPAPTQSSEDLAGFLEYFNNPNNKKKYQMFNNLEKELLYCHASNYSSHLRQIYRRLNSAAPLHYLYLRAVFYGTFFSVLLTILSDSLIVSFATENKKRKNSPDQSSFFLSTTSAVSRFLAGSMS